jgi:peptidyl-prolyl cis-trans isomerase D
MFEFIRTHSRLVLGALLLLIVPAFVLFGVEGYTQFTDGSNATVASVDGRSITRAEWELAHQRALERARRDDPERAATMESDTARRATLDQLVRERLLEVAAQSLHLAPADTRLRRLFAADPQFSSWRNPDGSVNREMLTANGMSSEMFAARLRADFAVQQVLQGVLRTAPATPAAADRALDAMLERREIQVQRFAPEEFRSRVSLADAELQAFYDARRDDFRAPEQAEIEYLTLELDAIAAAQTVADDEVLKFYDANPARFGTPEERRASHVLIRLEDGASADDKAKARARAEALLADARKEPARFAAIAREHSQDPGSAAQGGDLDFFARGAMVKPFEDAAFGLKVGEISDVFETDFGFHFLTVTAVRGGQRKPLDSVRDEIVGELRQSMARAEWAKASQAFSDSVYEQFDSLDPTASKLKLEKRRATVQRSPAEGAIGALASPKLLDAVFAAESLQDKRNTDAIEVGANQLVSARVLSHSPARVRPFEEVREAVRARLVAERAVELARKAGEARLEAARQQPGDALPQAGMLSRAAAQGAPRQLVDAIMGADTASLPAVVGVDLGEAGYVVARIVRVLPREPFPGGDDVARGQVAEAWAAAEADAYLASLRVRYKAEVKDGVKLETATATR